VRSSRRLRIKRDSPFERRRPGGGGAPSGRVAEGVGFPNATCSTAQYPVTDNGNIFVSGKRKQNRIKTTAFTNV
jgi:hypothetical protein